MWEGRIHVTQVLPIILLLMLDESMLYLCFQLSLFFLQMLIENQKLMQLQIFVLFLVGLDSLEHPLG